MIFTLFNCDNLLKLMCDENIVFCILKCLNRVSCSRGDTVLEWNLPLIDRCSKLGSKSRNSREVKALQPLTERLVMFLLSTVTLYLISYGPFFLR
jgi:hypothetical protein